MRVAVTTVMIIATNLLVQIKDATGLEIKFGVGINYKKRPPLQTVFFRLEIIKHQK